MRWGVCRGGGGGGGEDWFAQNWGLGLLGFGLLLAVRERVQGCVD